MSREPDLRLDERGRACPAPIIALGRAAKNLPAGGLIELLADDPAANTDVPAWCRIRGAELVDVAQVSNDGATGEHTRFLVEI